MKRRGADMTPAERARHIRRRAQVARRAKKTRRGNAPRIPPKR